MSYLQWAVIHFGLFVLNLLSLVLNIAVGNVGVALFAACIAALCLFMAVWNVGAHQRQTKEPE